MSPFSRRDIARLSLMAPLALASGNAFAQAKPNSRFNGVHLGIITGSLGIPAEQVIPALVDIGLSSIQLQSTHAEALAGAPAAGGGAALATPAAAPQLNADGLLPRCAALPLVMPYRSYGGEALVSPAPQTPEQRAAQARLWKWRRTTTPATWAAVRKRFNDAGIRLDTLWYGFGFNSPPDPTDEEMDYGFRMAKGLGVRAVSGSSQIRHVPRINRAAAKYGLTWAAHTQDNIHSVDQFSTPEAYDKILSMGKNIRICLDAGYFAASGYDSVAFIRKYHRNITDIHLKDRKRSKSLGGDVTNNTVNNYPFGQGDTPIREILLLLKNEKYDIPVEIEYNYGCRTISDSVTEIKRCLEYCRKILES